MKGQKKERGTRDMGGRGKRRSGGLGRIGDFGGKMAKSSSGMQEEEGREGERERRQSHQLGRGWRGRDALQVSSCCSLLLLTRTV